MKDAILVKLQMTKQEIILLNTSDTHAPRIKRESLNYIDNLITQVNDL